jgi:hypothetical protein
MGIATENFMGLDHFAEMGIATGNFMRFGSVRRFANSAVLHNRRNADKGLFLANCVVRCDAMGAGSRRALLIF